MLGSYSNLKSGRTSAPRLRSSTNHPLEDNQRRKDKRRNAGEGDGKVNVTHDADCLLEADEVRLDIEQSDFIGARIAADCDAVAAAALMPPMMKSRQTGAPRSALSPYPSAVPAYATWLGRLLCAPFKKPPLLSKSSFRFWLCGLASRRDFRPNLLRFLGQSQFTKPRHVLADCNRSVCFFLHDRFALSARKAISVRSGA